MVRSLQPPQSWSAVARAERLAATVTVLATLLLPTFAHAAEPTDGPVCLEPVRDEAGQPDPEIDRALRAAVPLIVTSSRAWRFGTTPQDCTGATRVRFLGHRVPEVRYTVEVQLPGQATESLAVDSHAGMGTFAVAEALCVNALLLLGQPIRQPQPSSELHLRLWLAPTGTFAPQVAVGGSEIGVNWRFLDHLWLAGSVGFEGFGSGANALGKYQYSVLEAAVHVGWRWQLGQLGLSAGLGLRERAWLSHLQTLALHEDYDLDLAVEAEGQVTLRLARMLRIGLAVRPSVALQDVTVAAPSESALLRVSRLLVQFAFQVAVEL